jgi:Tfp pilus assembly protein PilE
MGDRREGEHHVADFLNRNGRAIIEIILTALISIILAFISVTYDNITSRLNRIEAMTNELINRVAKIEGRMQ